LDEGWMYGYLSIQMHKQYQTIQIKTELCVLHTSVTTNPAVYYNKPRIWGKL